MIPTMILFGLVFGRRHRLSLIGAAIAWPLMLVANGVMSVGQVLMGPASVLAVTNAAVGVLLHQSVLHIVRASRSTTLVSQP